ncbi:hypothetical protein ACSBR2_027246 [Camellia fascicularis]
MSNGSLDIWIFQRHQELTLGWQSRRNIVLDIAKGLTYLHEECRQKIFHLDIKPQNILLDEDFNEKISDFGLSKLIDKDQSQVVTTMRGTPSYLAPEWLSSIITEKKRGTDGTEEDYLDQEVPGMSLRFSYRIELKVTD